MGSSVSVCGGEYITLLLKIFSLLKDLLGLLGFFPKPCLLLLVEKNGFLFLLFDWKVL